MAETIEQYSGVFKSRHLEVINGDAEHVRIILRGKDGSSQVLFTGSEFSEGEFQRRMSGRILP